MNVPDLNAMTVPTQESFLNWIVNNEERCRDLLMQHREEFVRNKAILKFGEKAVRNDNRDLAVQHFLNIAREQYVQSVDAVMEIPQTLRGNERRIATGGGDDRSREFRINTINSGGIPARVQLMSFSFKIYGLLMQHMTSSPHVYFTAPI